MEQLLYDLVSGTVACRVEVFKCSRAGQVSAVTALGAPIGVCVCWLNANACLLLMVQEED